MSWTFLQSGKAKSSGGVPSIAVTLSGVTAGDLIRVGISGYGASVASVVVGDNQGGTYTSLGFNNNSGIYVAESWCLAPVSGSITFTATPNVSADIEIGACEYSYASGATISTSTAVTHNSGGGGATSLTTGNVTFGSTGNYLLSGTFAQFGTGAWTAGSGFTLRVTDVSGGNYNLAMEDRATTSASSPLAATCTIGSNTSYSAIGVAYLETINIISPVPQIIPSNHGGNITLALTGIGTTWSAGTPGTPSFAVTGAGVTKVSQSIASATSATLVVTTGSSVGTCTIGDGTYSSPSLMVANATLALSPNGVGPSVGTTIAAKGFHTLWTTETAATLFTVSGVAGTSVASIVVTSDTAATFTFTSGASTGAATVTDASTAATATCTIYSSTPGITAVPSSLNVATVGLILTLTGVGTTWSGNPFTLVSPPAGTSITAQSVNSTTAATVTITTGSVSGTCTLFDGNYSATLTIVGPIVSLAYVARSPQLAMFLTSIQGIQTAVTSVASPPAIKVNGTTIAIAGPTYTDTKHQFPGAAYQLLCGSVAGIVVQTNGHGYTAPSATCTGGVTLGTPTLLNGGLAIDGSGFILNGGMAYTRGGNLIATDSTGAGTGFVGIATQSGGAFTNIVVESRGHSYTDGHTTFALSGEFSLGGTGAIFKAPTIANGGIINGMIGSIPVVSSPTNLVSGQTITITDATGSGAVAAALMSGPLSSDTVTYSASAGWLVTAAGGTIPAATNAAMGNYAGTLEPQFTTPVPTMPVGHNAMMPFGYTGGKSLNQNWLKGIQAPYAGASNPFLTITDSAGSLAIAYAVVGSTGTVTSYVVLCGGTNYVAPSVTVPAPPAGGTTAIPGVITVVGGVITAITTNIAGSGYGGSTVDGHPIAINATHDAANITTGGHPGAHIQFADLSGGAGGVNGTDGLGLPDQAGIWTYEADEVVANPMTVRVYAAKINTFFAATITHGSVVGGVEIGKIWSFNVVRPTGQGYLNLQLDFVAVSTGVSAPWSHSNEYLTAPDRTTGLAVAADRSNPYKPDINLVNWLTLSGSVGAASVRCWPFHDYAWYNNVVDASDLRAFTDFTWGDSTLRNTYCTVKAIRAYQIWSGSSSYYSPYVWTKQAYPGTLPTSGLSPSAIATYWGVSTPPAYYWIPPGNTSANSLDWMGKGTSGASQEFACEFQTVVPHGLKTGQQIVEIPSNALTSAVPAYDPNFNSGAGRNTIVPINGEIVSVWVTSETTFAIVTQYSSQITAGHVANCIGINTQLFNLTFSLPPGQNAAPYEAFCGLANAIPNCGLHTFAPPFATDACLTALLTAIQGTLNSGLPVYLEPINEHWNAQGGTGGNFQNMYSMAGICAGNASIRANRPQDFYAYLAAHEQQIGLNLGLNMVRVFGGQGRNGAIASNIINYVNTFNGTSPAVPIRIDALMQSAYTDMPGDVSVASAAASTYSNYIGSTQYQSANPWTMAMYLDFVRHFLFYCTAPFTTSTTSVIPQYHLVSGQSSPPYAMCYEASIEVISPPGVSITDWSLRGAIAHDASYHPYMADANYAFHLANQLAGNALEVTFDIQNIRSQAGGGTTINGTTDEQGAVIWGDTTWEGQTWGRGDGSADGNGNATVNVTFNATGLSQDLANVSPKLQGWRDWLGANPAGTIALTPATLPTNHSGHIVIALTGTGTTWVNGTTVFTLSGVSGLIKISQTVSSTTTATITVTTGSSTGMFTISDGTFAGMGFVAAATLAINPSGSGRNVTIGVAATGGSTLWSTETASTLFSISGVSGTSISSIVVTSDTSAAFNVTTGSSYGAATITDNSTTATTAFNVSAPGSMVWFPWINT